MAHRISIFHFWLALSVFCSHTVHGATPRFSFFGRKPKNRTIVPLDEHSWTDFLTVDPSKIMATLIHRGGLVLPKSIQEELLALVKVCHVEQAKWNPVQKRLLLTNFTVSMPDNPRYSLRVGRVSVSWESYTKPCVNIEVDDVDVLLEFANLLLTKNNWDELRAAGFPPAMMMVESNEASSPSNYSFVRIGSMDLSGTLRAEIRSRPLDKEICPPWTMDLDRFDEWTLELQRLSDENLVKSGRRGCTADQLYEWMETFVGGKMRKVLRTTAFDLATQPFADKDTRTVNRAKGFFHQARKSVWSYARDASQKSGKDLQDKVQNKVIGRLDSMGIKDRVLGFTFGDANLTGVEEEGVEMQKVTAGYQKLLDAAAERLEKVYGALKAAEDADVGQPAIVFVEDR